MPSETREQAEKRMTGRVAYIQARVDKGAALGNDLDWAKRELADFYACWNPDRVIDGWHRKAEATSKASRML